MSRMLRIGGQLAVIAALFAAVAFVSALWWIELIGNWIGSGFGGLGVAPRTLSGLIGILTSPLVHGSVGHLINNTLPLIVLGTLALAIYPRAFKPAMALIWIGSGLGIWLFGRDSFHIGASGLNHGLMFFLFMLGLLRRDRPAVAAAMIEGVAPGLMSHAPGMLMSEKFHWRTWKSGSFGEPCTVGPAGGPTASAPASGRAARRQPGSLRM